MRTLPLPTKRSLTPWLLAALLAACSGSPDEASSEPTAASEQAATATPPPLPTECTDRDLVGDGGPDSRCEGPWQWQELNHPCVRPNACSSSPPNITYGHCNGHYYSCRHPQHGFESDDPRPYRWDITIRGTWVQTGDCDPDRPGSCNARLWYFQRNDESCDQKRQNIWNREIWTSWPTHNAVISSWETSPARPSKPVCTVVLSNPPLWREMKSPFCGTSPAHDCSAADFDQPDWFGRPLHPECSRVEHMQDCIDPRGSCGMKPGVRYSSASISLAELTSVNPVDNFVDPASAVCLTGENQTEASLTWKDRFNFMNSKLLTPPAGLPDPARAQLRTVLIRQLKLLLERHAEDLDAAQINAAFALYGSEPAIAPSCVAAITPPVTEASCGTAELDKLLRACSRFIGPQVTNASAAVLIDRCLKPLADEMVKVPASANCHAGEYRTLVTTLLDDLIKKAIVRPLPAQGSDNDANFDGRLLVFFQDRLVQLSSWYDAAKRVRSLADNGNHKDLWLQSSRVVELFWSTAYAGVTYNETDPASIEQVSNHHLRVGRLVLLAAFKPVGTAAGATPPLQTSPLLYVVNDALAGAGRRLTDVADFHDLACRFKYPSCEGGHVKTAVSEMWSLIGHVHNVDELRSTVGGLVRVGEDWQLVFRALRDQHVVLDSAILEAAGNPAGRTALDVLMSDANPPQPVRQLAGLLRDARDHAESYARTGFFRVTPDRSLTTGIYHEKVDDILRDFDLQVGKLAIDVTRYNQDYLSLVQAVLGKLANGADEDKLRVKLNELLMTMQNLRFDADTLRGVNQLEDVRFADFMKEFQDTAATLTDPKQTISSSPIAPLSVRGAPVFVPDFGRSSILHMATSAVPYRGLVAGQVLNLSVDGQWSASCAVEQIPLSQPNPAGGPALTVTVGGGFGPEGMRVVVDNGQFKTATIGHSDATSKYTTQGMSNKWCLSSSIGASWHFILDAEVKISAEHCGIYDFGKRDDSTDTTSNSSGSDNRMSVHASVGLRHPMTPIREAPVGSLVMVALPRGVTDMARVVDMRVLQSGNNAFIAPSDVDVYLVVNDINLATCTNDRDQALIVTGTTLTPVGVMARTFGHAMARTLNKFREETETRYVGRGRITPSELSTMRIESMNELHAACVVAVREDNPNADPGTVADACNPSQYPAPFMGLFNTWVNMEVARRERVVELEGIRRQMAASMLEFSGYEDELVDANNRGRLHKLVTELILRNLDAETMRDGVRQLVDFTNEFLYPVLVLRYADALAAIRAPASSGNSNETQVALSNLLEADWTLPVGHYADLARIATGKIRLELDRVKSRATPLSTKTVALSFPNPDASFPPVGGNPRPPFVSALRTVDATRTHLVWDAITGTLPAGATELAKVSTFVVQPEDLYSQSLADWELLCTQTVPVIRDMVVYVATPGITAFNVANGTKTVQVWLDAAAHFPAALENLVFQIINGTWLVPTPLVLLGMPTQMEQITSARLVGNSALGLSPFMSFDMNLRDLAVAGRSPWPQAKEIVLVFKVEAAPANPGINWLRACGAGAPPPGPIVSPPPPPGPVESPPPPPHWPGDDTGAPTPRGESPGDTPPVIPGSDA